jgi:hypothetical protein
VYLDFPGPPGVAPRRADRARIRERAPEIAAPHADPAAIDRIAALLAGAERPAAPRRQGRGMGGCGRRARRARRPGHPLRHVADGTRHDPRRSPLLHEQRALDARSRARTRS